MKKKICIMFGGKSSEYEVSLLSAASVIRAIDKEKYDLVYIGITKDGFFKAGDFNVDEIENGSWVNKAKDFDPWKLKDICDFVLPIVHGPNCEDGKLQGLFEMLNIPYGGCGVLASALAMDKLLAKDVFSKAGLPICKHIAVFKFEYEKDSENEINRIERELGYPVFVKPANMGSSVGISKAHDREELIEAIKEALKYDRRLIVEESINCREIECAVLGNEEPKAASLGEILPETAEFYDYKAKYTDGASRLEIPAKLPKEVYEKIRELAVKAYAAIDGEGFSRCDFFVSKEDGRIFINEINTIPGFTKFSMFPLLWEDAGLKYKDTIERIIELGYERYNAKNNR